MNSAEAYAIVGPEGQERIRREVASAPPLTPAQVSLLVALFDMAENLQHEAEAAA